MLIGALCLSRCGEFDADGEAAAFCLGERGVALVSCEDSGDDREAEAGSAGLAVARCVRAVEAFEDASAVSFVDAGPVVAQFDDGGVAAASERDFDRGSLLGV